jgi:hypothetical protein
VKTYVKHPSATRPLATIPKLPPRSLAMRAS